MKDMNNCLKIGGKLLLSTPNFDFIPMYGDPIGKVDPINPIEDGGHVRIGYKPNDIQLLCDNTGFTVNEISYCSGFFSQKISSIFRFLNANTHPLLSWIFIFPFRIIPPMLDPFIKCTKYSICLVATKKGLNNKNSLTQTDHF